MSVPDLSAAEWHHLAQGLRARSTQLPKTGTFQPFYNATTWDHDDLYRAAREDAIRSRTTVLQLVADYKVQGAWPRGRYEAKFWLQARWTEAATYAQALAGTAADSASPPTPPKDARAATAWLLYDAWDSQQVDYWLAENLPDYTTFESYGTSFEDYAYYSKWIDRVRAGHYIRK